MTSLGMHRITPTTPRNTRIRRAARRTRNKRGKARKAIKRKNWSIVRKRVDYLMSVPDQKGPPRLLVTFLYFFVVVN